MSITTESFASCGDVSVFRRCYHHIEDVKLSLPIKNNALFNSCQQFSVSIHYPKENPVGRVCSQ